MLKKTAKFNLWGFQLVPVVKDKEIEMVAARYGIKNIYIEKYTLQQTQEGIDNYNELTDAYLTLRNGPNWKSSYKREVDSLYEAAATGIQFIHIQ